MKQIPLATIEKTWEKLSEMSVYDAPRLLERLSQRQPLIYAYLMASGDDLLNEDERELMLFLGVVIWETMSQGMDPLLVVAEETLVETETANLQLMDELWRIPEHAIDRTLEFLDEYNQAEVLRMVFEALMEESDEDGAIRDENIGNILIYLKTMIDCFDQ